LRAFHLLNNIELMSSNLLIFTLIKQLFLIDLFLKANLNNSILIILLKNDLFFMQYLYFNPIYVVLDT